MIIEIPPGPFLSSNTVCEYDVVVAESVVLLPDCDAPDLALPVMLDCAALCVAELVVVDGRYERLNDVDASRALSMCAPLSISFAAGSRRNRYGRVVIPDWLNRKSSTRSILGCRQCGCLSFQPQDRTSIIDLRILCASEFQIINAATLMCNTHLRYAQKNPFVLTRKSFVPTKYSTRTCVINIVRKLVTILFLNDVRFDFILLTSYGPNTDTMKYLSYGPALGPIR